MHEEPGFSRIKEYSREHINAIKSTNLQGQHFKHQRKKGLIPYVWKLLSPRSVWKKEPISKSLATGLDTILLALRTPVSDVSPHGTSSERFEVAKFTALQELHTGARTASISPKRPCKASQTQSLRLVLTGQGPFRLLFFFLWGFCELNWKIGGWD